MAAGIGNRKQTSHLNVFFIVVCLTLLQVQLIVCEQQRTILTREARSITPPNYESIAPVTLHDAVYSPRVPFLGELSEELSVGKVITVSGYVPDDLREFQINLCSDCSSEGPIHLHVSARFFQGFVVRNSYEDDRWKAEERDGGMPFTLNHVFVVSIEVKEDAYVISVDGHPTWRFLHRVPYSSVDKIEIKGAPVVIWKVQYTDKRRHQNPQLNGDITSGMTVNIGGNPSDIFQRFTMDLKCECRTQSSSSSSSQEDTGKKIKMDLKCECRSQRKTSEHDSE